MCDALRAIPDTAWWPEEPAAVQGVILLLLGEAVVVDLRQQVLSVCRRTAHSQAHMAAQLPVSCSCLCPNMQHAEEAADPAVQLPAGLAMEVHALQGLCTRSQASGAVLTLPHHRH